MPIFNRPAEDEGYDYDEEDLQKLDERKPNPRKFKDLKPENRKKRKEPIKPWGRRERLMTLFVFLTTIIIAAGLAVSARNWKLPGLPRISLPDFLGEEVIIVGDKNVSDKDQEKIKEAKNKFKELTKNRSGLYAFLVIDLRKGYSYGVNERETMQAASLIKLPVLATLYKEAEKGRLDLETKYTLKQTDKVPGAGILASRPAGTVVTYRELARYMGKESDNTAFGIVRRLLGDDKINKLISEIGMEKTSLDQNRTTPEDIGNFFKKLWNQEILSKKGQEEILDYLTNTAYENWLVAGIPKEVKVAHKYGREIHTVNDAGIVFAPSPFVLVIMSDGVIEGEADEVIPKIAEQLYDLETKN